MSINVADVHDDDFLSPNQSTASMHSHQKGYVKLSNFCIQRHFLTAASCYSNYIFFNHFNKIKLIQRDTTMTKSM